MLCVIGVYWLLNGLYKNKSILNAKVFAINNYNNIIIIGNYKRFIFCMQMLNF